MTFVRIVLGVVETSVGIVAVYLLLNWIVIWRRRRKDAHGSVTDQWVSDHRYPRDGDPRFK